MIKTSKLSTQYERIYISGVKQKHKHKLRLSPSYWNILDTKLIYT